MLPPGVTALSPTMPAPGRMLGLGVWGAIGKGPQKDVNQSCILEPPGAAMGLTTWDSKWQKGRWPSADRSGFPPLSSWNG